MGSFYAVDEDPGIAFNRRNTMSSTRRPPIKPISREPKKAASALQDCRCFDEVERRVRMGWSAPDLVKFIQEDSQELTHLSSAYVRKMVDEFRRTIPPAELLITTQNTTVAMHAAQKVANGMEELAKLSELYDLQMDRIKIDVENEKKINKLFQTTGREIFYAMKILKQTSDLKMDLGLAKRQLGEVSVSGSAAVQISDRYTDGVGKVMADPDGRRKVLGMVEALMALSAKANLDATEIVRSATEFVGDDVIDVESSDSSELGSELPNDENAEGDSE
jgi:hypothetical protein